MMPTTLVVLTTLVLYVDASYYKVQEINESQPIAAINLGDAYITQNYKSITHVVDIDNYIECTEQLSKTIQNLQVDPILYPSLSILKSKLANLEEKVYNLTPHNKQKRGIINGLGSLIKTITGNMDSADAEEIFKQLENLKSNEKRQKEKDKTQDHFNHEMSQVEISQSYHTTALYSGLGVILTLTIILWIQRRRKIIMFPYHMDQPLDVTPPIPSLWPFYDGHSDPSISTCNRFSDDAQKPCLRWQIVPLNCDNGSSSYIWRLLIPFHALL
nr:uncharacterized protein LOC122322011 [Drosophila bipectinata]